MTDEAPWSLTIPSDLRLLALARSFIESVCQVAGLDETQTHRIVLAVDEATNNAVKHAHKSRPEASIRLRCWATPGRLEIHLLDEGEPFDFNAVPELDPGDPLRPGGRGVFLMRLNLDEVTSAVRPEGGNLLRMVKNFPPPG